MKGIKLTQNKVALVDDEDFEMISNLTWHAIKTSYNFYAVNGIRLGEDKKQVRQIFMHRLIMNCPDGMVVDHINGNGLDNRKENLRICTTSQNLMNRGKSLVNTSGYKGVYRSSNKNSLNKWRARIILNKKSINLGYYETREMAAIAYNEGALKYHKEFANLNTI